MSKFILGIDLGTTNSALASIDASVEGASASIEPIRQLVAPAEHAPEPLLPSSLYLAAPKEFPDGATELPWDADAPVIGRLAVRRGGENPSRLVTSAKSWLSHSGVDRSAAILPWHAAEAVTPISPVDASRLYLEHIREAWDDAHPDTQFLDQQVLITVPASFDAVARDLTERAAKAAGYREVTLLEEPQAAFYAWIERHPDWRERVAPGDLILVVDIGGGTTDFTLIAVKDDGGSLALERVAVGEHILLGGDNMDLALARSIEAELLATKSTKLDARQLGALWTNCRLAKEKLLNSKAASEPVVILGRGSGLIGGTIKAQLRRETLEQILRDGFFPECPSTEMPQRRRGAALQELGLPYAADPAITRHLAQFLRQSGSLAQPTHVLFNGGVLHAGILRDRLLSVLNSWLDQPAAVLEGEDLMHAVARGAAYYGLARQGRGVRIRGGISRTYYVGIESSMPAVPGFANPLKALAVAPFGMEEGTEAGVPGSGFGLITGEPASFRFLASASRKHDTPGTVIEPIGDDIEELSPIEVTLDGDAGSTVPVSLETRVTETGVLELFCVARDGRRWKLEFNVRERV